MRNALAGFDLGLRVGIQSGLAYFVQTNALRSSHRRHAIVGSGASEAATPA